MSTRLTTLQRTEVHAEGIWSARWSAKNRLLTGGQDESVKHFEEKADGTLGLLHSYEGHTLGVVSVDVHSSGQVAASSSLDSVIRVWNLESHATLDQIETAAMETWAVAFSPDSNAQQLNFATAGGTCGGVLLWEMGQESSRMHAEMRLPPPKEERGRPKERFVLSVAYSPDGKRLACGAMDGTVALFDVASTQLLGLLEGHYKPVRSLAFTPDSSMLLTACDDMHVNLYDVENKALVESFSGHDSWVLSVAPHPSGTCFVSGGSDAKVKLWDLGTRTCIQTLTDHTDQVWSVAFNPDGSRLVSASDDKTIVTYSCA
mmetsp:Transcript_22400/g.61887  ORF Transcript_22400/g.61887 Transcript_22400/m.61887 type:complete len:317 (+) Transcript_22400:46-996(+)